MHIHDDKPSSIRTKLAQHLLQHLDTLKCVYKLNVSRDLLPILCELQVVDNLVQTISFRGFRN